MERRLVGSITSLIATLGSQQSMAQGQDLTISAVQIDNPYVSQQEMWLQPPTDPWLSTTVDWETAEWRYGNVVDLAAQFGEEQDYISNKNVLLKK